MLTAILGALLWCGSEIHRLGHRETTVSPRPIGTTVYYYVPDGTCINVPLHRGDQE